MRVCVHMHVHAILHAWAWRQIQPGTATPDADGVAVEDFSASSTAACIRATFASFSWGHRDYILQDISCMVLATSRLSHPPESSCPKTLVIQLTPFGAGSTHGLMSPWTW